jgi:ABC-2 type transport system permease protein
MNMLWIVALAIIVVLAITRRLVMPHLNNTAQSNPRRRRPFIKNRSYVALRGLTIASLKMYFRNRTALFFSLFFPIVFIVIFGFIFKDSKTTLKLDLTSQANTQLADQFKAALNKLPVFKIKEVSESQGATDLDKGDADLAVVIPSNFGQIDHAKVTPAVITAHYNGAKPQNGQAAAQIVQQLAGSFNDAITHNSKVITLSASGVETKNLSYIDFLLPGMVGLSIMQLGIFSVAFGFIALKTTGMLRRIQATPIHPSSFLMAQGITRLIMAVLQTALLAGIGVALFGFHLAPHSWLPFVVLSLLGSTVFMAFGFAIAGWAQNEDQAQPVAQLIQFPMMFLSGTFFPRDSFPPILQTVTGFLPLTYLADAMRHVANDGASLWVVRADLLGLVVWGLIAGFVSVRLFHWE